MAVFFSKYQYIAFLRALIFTVVAVPIASKTNYQTEISEDDVKTL